MTPRHEQLHALVRYRIAQADETVREARILLAQELWRGATNRAYYAMFYSALALMAGRQLTASKHSGVIALFDREFVKRGLLPRTLSRSLRSAFNLRQKYDYGEIVEPDREGAHEMVKEAETFISTVAEFLRSEGFD
jgi:uncharacterized protein (UPF0332 family)